MTAPDSIRDPTLDDRADYDYRDDDSDPAANPPATDDPRGDLAVAIETHTDADVRFDDYSRSLYATDASAYEVTPVGVAFPTDTDDVATIVELCRDRGVAVLPRGGGTSLAGQAVNEAVVLDFTRSMDDVVDVDPDAGTATAQPGAILGELNATLEPHDLKFAPDPAWGDKSTLGGAIGNNSTGAHSLQYGKTDAYLREAEVVLADGTVETFGETPLDEIRDGADPDGDALERVYAAVARIVDENADAVREAYPELKRNVSGYNLDRLVEGAGGGDDPSAGPGDRENPPADHRENRDADDGYDHGGDDRTVNLAQLLAGSEGTLAVVTAATVGLEPIPETKAVALLTYDDLVTAMEDVAPILAHDPAAVEVLDDVLLGLAADTPEFADLVGMLPAGTDSVLLVEFYADSDREGQRKVAGLLADRCPAADPAGDPPEEYVEADDQRRAIAALEAHDPDQRERFWSLRKSGLPILLSRTTDEKHISFVEDTAVPPATLPEYVRDFQRVLEAHDTYASFYAHAGPGVLHVRPLVDTKTVEGLDRMESIAEAVTDLVVEYGGSVSGEHGDGRARTQFNRKLYGETVFELFVEVKRAFDPAGILNPGQVCGDLDLTENLRFDPDYEFAAGFDPDLAWADDGGFQGMVELCHGCGGCRGSQSTTGGAMCPTYRAADEEILSTRGRANALRRAMNGELPEDELFDDQFRREVLDLCVGCKGCLRDCPSGVDVAKLKAEVTYQHHQREGAGLRDRLFARIHDLSGVGSTLAPVSNWVQSLPGADRLAERVGIATERDLPTFRRETLTDWFQRRGPTVDHDAAERKAVLFPDTYTDRSDPEIGKAAVEVLEAANVRVRIPEDLTGSGRPPYSKGFLELAARRGKHNVERLAPLVDRGWDVVVVEPSDAVMIQSDYADLLSGDPVQRVAENTYGIAEYLDRFDLLAGVETAVGRDPDEGPLVYHSHCHQHATKREEHAPAVLRTVGYDVDAIDSGCCGMAGAFGYEAEHYSMSRAIGSILDGQIRQSPGEDVVAPGTSCRAQIADFEDHERPDHPIERVADALE